MPNVSMLPTIFREVFGKRTLPREPEPDLVMDDEQQVRDYKEAGSVDSVMSAAYLFHSARVSQLLQNGRKSVLDLGCGPAVQLAQIAQFNPEVQFHGVDLSSEMLRQAAKQVADLKLTNVRFSQGDITDLPLVPTGSVDMVISTMALHHLPSIGHLRACFKEISRVLKPGGAIYLTDFGRMKSLKSVIYFAYMNEKYHPHLHLFWLDYERSLRAAFQFKEIKSLARELLPSTARTYGTFLSPFLVVVQTKPEALAPDLSARIKQMRRELPRRYRADLDDMRLFFKLGGQPADPFSA
ncbi:MAG: hypothetical protein AUK51_13005 [Comamonadaceae bacterium CG2_30_59_20]|nr:MAG: hypothetical protein AUK51_13005 [Comamonadaceae bacterium CG2_30_59_20]